MSISNDIDIRLVELLPYGIDPKVYERGYLDLREVIDNTEGILEEKGEEKSLGDYFRIYEVAAGCCDAGCEAACGIYPPCC